MTLKYALMGAIAAAGVVLASSIVSTSAQAVTFGNPQNPPPTLNNIPKEDHFEEIIVSPFDGNSAATFGSGSWTIHQAVPGICPAGGCSGVAPVNIGGNGIDTAPTIDARPGGGDDSGSVPGPWANDSTANTEILASSTFNAGETSSNIFGASWFSFANTGFRDQPGGGLAQVVLPDNPDDPAGGAACTDASSIDQRSVCDQQSPIATWMFEVEIFTTNSALGLWVYADDTAEVYLSGPGLERTLWSLAADPGNDANCSGGGTGGTPDQIGCQPGEFAFLEAFQLPEGIYKVEFETFQFNGFEYGLLYSGGVVVPEPATIAIFGAGLLGLGVMRRRRRRDAA